MHRLRHIAFNTLAAISLALALLTAGPWVRSYFANDVLKYESLFAEPPVQTWARHTLGSGRGTIFYDYTFDRSADVAENIAERANLGFTHATFKSESINTSDGDPEDVVVAVSWLGLRVEHYSDEDNSDGVRQANCGYFIALPSWLLVALLLILPMLRLLMFWRVRNRRNRANGCPTCGYDLRATPDRCPNAERRERRRGDLCRRRDANKTVTAAEAAATVRFSAALAAPTARPR